MSFEERVFISGEKRPMINRGDLIRYYHKKGSKGLKEAAKSAGYYFKEESKQSNKKKEVKKLFSNLDGHNDEKISPVESRINLPEVSFYYVDEIKILNTEGKVNDVPEWYKKAKPIKEMVGAFDEGEKVPEKRELIPWASMWPFLKTALGMERKGHEIDIPKSVEKISKGEVLKKLPKRKKNSWSPFSMIILDFNTRLQPFWDEIHSIARKIEKIRGTNGLSILMMDNNPFNEFTKWGKKEMESGWFNWSDPGTNIFIISDLGCYDKTGTSGRVWKRFGRILPKFCNSIIYDAKSRHFKNSNQILCFKIL